MLRPKKLGRFTGTTGQAKVLSDFFRSYALTKILI